MFSHINMENQLSVRIIALAFVLAFLSGGYSLEARTFTSTDGRKLEATVTKVAGESAVLKLTNGRSVTVPFDRLSEGDRSFLAEWAKEDAKNRVPRVDIEINSNKRDSTEEAGSDDRLGSVKFEINATNEERGFRVEKATATLIVIGEDVDEKDELLVMQRTEFKDIAFDFGKTYQMTAKEVRYEYDKIGIKHGIKYSAYLFVMRTAAGKVIDVSGTSSRIEGLAEPILKLKEGERCNSRYEKLGGGGSSTIIR